MATFSELLTEYTQRTGITDTELARSVGVRRQTIFRWKEGLVARPRNREDVLKCAQRLRLSPGERDELLLAAGFPPERTAEDTNSDTETPDTETPDTQTPDTQTPDTETPDTETSKTEIFDPETPQTPALDAQTENNNDSSAAPSLFRPPFASVRHGLYVGAALLLLAGTVALFLSRSSTWPMWLRLAVPTATPAVQAAEGESLLLVAQFRNYIPNIRYNVSGRLQDALQTQIDLGKLEDVRVTQWPTPIDSAAQAQTVLGSSGATLLVWGEYDSGRVLVNFTTRDPSDGSAGSAIDAEMEQHLPSPDDLSATINVDVPQQVRGVAMLTLGRLYRSRSEWERARVALEEALALSLPNPMRETVYFYLGTVYTHSVPPDLDRAIDAYTQALALRPNDANALYNRGKAYLERYQLASGATGAQDLTLALDDLSRTIELKPEYAAAYNNRGIVYYVRNGDGDMPSALSDLDRAVALDAEAVEYRYNRALGHIRLDNADEWQSDLGWVLENYPEYTSARVALCWAHVLDQQPDRALPHCRTALEQDPSRHDVHDSLGLAYAQRNELDQAVEHFQAYLEWLQTLPPAAYAQYNGPLVESWLEAIESGQNPIDAAALNALR